MASKLASDLDEDQKIVTREYYNNEFKFKLVSRKGVFPYEYIVGEKLQETSLPPIRLFYSKLTNSI